MHKTSLAIGGLDPSGGAGILMDARAMARAGAYPTAIAASLTVQSTQGLTHIEPVASELVRAQLAALLDDMHITVIKTGALGSDDNATMLAEVLDQRDSRTALIVDPVLSPTRGTARLAASVEGLMPLLRRADLITPNVGEASALLGAPIRSHADAREAVAALRALSRHAALLKGGHLDDHTGRVTDWLAIDDKIVPIRHKRHDIGEVHGTGCALASLIAGRMAATLRHDIEASVRWSIHNLGRWLRSHSGAVGRGMRVLLALSLWLVASTTAAQEPKTKPEPPKAAACDPSCVTSLSALSTIARAIALGLGKLPDGTLLAIAPLESDEPAPKADALADQIASLVAGKIGPSANILGRRSLDEARAAAKQNAPGTIYLTPKIHAGRLVVSADLYAIPRTVWARAAGAASPGPVRHVVAHAPLDAEVRTFLEPIGFDRTPKVAKYDGADPDMLDLACGDLDGDGANELVTLSRSRILTVALRNEKVERLREARWETLLQIAPAPLRQPMGFATIVEGPNAYQRAAYLDVSITDRAGSARLSADLSLIDKLEGTALPHGRATACTWVFNLLLGEKMIACTKREPAPSLADVKHRADAFASGHVIATDGSGQTFVALRDANTLYVRTHDGDRIIARVGAQLAIGDIDQDGAPDVVSTMDVLSGKFDALEVRTISPSGEVTRRYRVPVNTGIEALTLCPPDGAGRAPIVLASQGKLWVVR